MGPLPYSNEKWASLILGFKWQKDSNSVLWDLAGFVTSSVRSIPGGLAAQLGCRAALGWAGVKCQAFPTSSCCSLLSVPSGLSKQHPRLWLTSPPQVSRISGAGATWGGQNSTSSTAVLPRCPLTCKGSSYPGSGEDSLSSADWKRSTVERC